VGAGLNLASLGFLLRATERMLIHVGGQGFPVVALRHSGRIRGRDADVE
jgi:hypothetical protein